MVLLVQTVTLGSPPKEGEGLGRSREGTARAGYKARSDDTGRKPWGDRQGLFRETPQRSSCLSKERAPASLPLSRESVSL